MPYYVRFPYWYKFNSSFVAQKVEITAHSDALMSKQEVVHPSFLVDLVFVCISVLLTIGTMWIAAHIKSDQSLVSPSVPTLLMSYPCTRSQWFYPPVTNRLCFSPERSVTPPILTNRHEFHSEADPFTFHSTPLQPQPSSSPASSVNNVGQRAFGPVITSEFFSSCGDFFVYSYYALQITLMQVRVMTKE